VIILVFLFVDKSHLGKSIVDKLQLSSFNSMVYEPVFDSEATHNSNIKMIDKALVKENVLLANAKEVKRVGSGVIGTDDSEDVVINPILGDVSKLESSIKMKGGIWPVFMQTKLPPLYYFYAGQKRCYLGCSAIFFPEGIHWHFIGITLLRIHPGVIENFVYYTALNNPIISCMFCIKYAQVSRNGRRIIYLISNCFTFFVQAFTGSIFNLYGDQMILSNAFDVLVVSPLVSQIEDVILFLYQMRNTDVNGRGFVVRCLHQLRSLILLMMVLVALSSILFSSLFAYNSDNLAILRSFFLYVQLPAFIYQVAVTMLRFVSTYHFLIYVRWSGRSVTLINIGEYYIESLFRRHAIEGKDYITQEYSLFFRSLVCNYVIEKKYADEKGLKKVALSPVTNDNYETEEDVENASRYSTIYCGKDVISYSKRYNIETVVNTIAEDIKLASNNDDELTSIKIGDEDATSDIAMVEIYKDNNVDEALTDQSDRVERESSNLSDEVIAPLSSHSKFMHELRGSARFMEQREQSEMSNVNPMHSLAKLFPANEETDVEYASYRGSVTEGYAMSYEEWFATKRGEKFEGKRKSFVKVLHQWEELESRAVTSGSISLSSKSVAEKIMENTKRTKSKILTSKKSSMYMPNPSPGPS